MLEAVEVGRDVVLLVLVAAASWNDVRRGKVPNWCTVPAIVLGFLMNIVLDSGSGGSSFVAENRHLLSAAAGAGIALTLLGLFWRSGALGGGDVKLAVAIGAIKGFAFVIWAIACGSLVGAFMAVGMMAARGRLKEGMVSAGRLAARPWMWGRKLDEDAAPVTIPYGLAFALGSLWVWAVW